MKLSRTPPYSAAIGRRTRFTQLLVCHSMGAHGRWEVVVVNSLTYADPLSPGSSKSPNDWTASNNQRTFVDHRHMIHRETVQKDQPEVRQLYPLRSMYSTDSSSSPSAAHLRHLQHAGHRRHRHRSLAPRNHDRSPSIRRGPPAAGSENDPPNDGSPALSDWNLDSNGY